MSRSASLSEMMSSPAPGTKRVIQHDVRLVLVAWTPTVPLLLSRRVDDLFPGDGLAHVEIGLLREDCGYQSTCVSARMRDRVDAVVARDGVDGCLE